MIGWAPAWAGLANAQTTYTWTRGGDAAAWNNSLNWSPLGIRLSGSPSIVNDSASSLSFGNPANFVSGTYRPGSSIQSVVGTASTVTFPARAPETSP